MKKTVLQTIILLLFSAHVFADYNCQLEVSIYQQPDSPMQIRSAIPKLRMAKDDKGRDVNMLAVHLELYNVSSKTIRAYAIRMFEGDYINGNNSTMFTNITKTPQLLQPNQTRKDEMSEYGYSILPSNLKIAVDFVEFTDGSTWGQDVSKSSERLAGQRAGANAALEYLRRINTQNGIEAVINSLNELKISETAKNKTSLWKAGFKSGVSNIKNRLKRAYEKEGVKAVEMELRTPFDTSSND